jgi:hypothetical protein
MSEPVDLTDAPNDPTPAGGVHADTVYAFGATDGFVMERQFADITLRPADTISRFDVVDSVQVTVAASVFNTKLGVFDTVDDCFKIDGTEVDEITFTSEDFRTALEDSENVLSVGSLSTLYTDFKTYVGVYFGFNGGFETLFAAASEFNIDENNVFDADALAALIAGEAAGEDPATPYTKVMTGSITISNITKLLRFAVDSNCFGNRVPDSTAGTSGAAGDAANFGVNNGFLPNDLIWVPTGIEITLKLAIDAESFNPINNRGPNYVQSTDLTNGNFSSNTTATTTLITRVVKVPMLIRLKE